VTGPNFFESSAPRPSTGIQPSQLLRPNNCSGAPDAGIADSKIHISHIVQERGGHYQKALLHPEGLFHDSFIIQGAGDNC